MGLATVNPAVLSGLRGMGQLPSAVREGFDNLAQTLSRQDGLTYATAGGPGGKAPGGGGTGHLPGNVSSTSHPPGASGEAMGGAGGIRNGGTVELFTDANGPKVPGAVGVGPTDPRAVATDATNMPNIPSNSQATVVANNPYIPVEAGGTLSMMDFLPEASRITQPGGRIVINGTIRNPYTELPSAAQLEELGLRFESRVPLKPEYQGGVYRTVGCAIMPTSSMSTITLIKK